MLVLTRKVNETLVIDGKITVQIISFPSSGQVKLGINAPREVIVDRGEIDVIRRAGSALPDPNRSGDYLFPDGSKIVQAPPGRPYWPWLAFRADGSRLPSDRGPEGRFRSPETAARALAKYQEGPASLPRP